MEGVLHIGHFRFEFTQAWRRIADQLTGQTRERWCLLLAADAVENAEPDDDQVRLLRAANALTNPMWLVRSMYNAYTDHDPVDFAGAGAVIAQLGEHYAGRTDSDEAAAVEEYGWLSDDMHGSDDVVSIFEGVLTWLQATPHAQGYLLRLAWSACLLEHDGKTGRARI